jgi:iturin family lipopeptide synthetase A
MNVEANRKSEIVNNLKKVISTVYEMDTEEVDVNISFLEMGLDSISIIQVKQLVKNEYRMDVSVNRLFDDIDTLDKLADFIDATLPAPVKQATQLQSLETKTTEPHVDIPFALPAANTLSGDSEDLQKIINYQLQIMAKQIDMMTKLNFGQ